MWGGEWLWISKVIEQQKKLQQEANTNKIQKKSAKEIRENFELLNNWLLRNSLTYLVQNDPNIKKILCIPELQDFTLKILNTDHTLSLEWSTAFDGNLRQLLLKNWINKNNLQYTKDWIVARFYWSTLQIYIIQKKLSS